MKLKSHPVVNVYGALFLLPYLSFHSVFTEQQNLVYTYAGHLTHGNDIRNFNRFNSTKYGNVSSLKNQLSKSTGQTRQGRSQQLDDPHSNVLHNGAYYTREPYQESGGSFYSPLSHVSSKADISSTLESPFLHVRQDDYNNGVENYGYYDHYSSTEAPVAVLEETDDEEEEEEDATTTEAPETTTLAPFTLADVKVPAPFLRIEYMISFTFFGVLYGLGFLVLFQSLCVPAAKLAVYFVYIMLLKAGVVDPVTLEQALEQLPPI